MSFEPNGYGLYDMAGNIWEWCKDWYHFNGMKEKDGYKGPTESLDPQDPWIPKRVVHRIVYVQLLLLQWIEGSQKDYIQ